MRLNSWLLGLADDLITMYIRKLPPLDRSISLSTAHKLSGGLDQLGPQIGALSLGLTFGLLSDPKFVLCHLSNLPGDQLLCDVVYAWLPLRCRTSQLECTYQFKS